ncbi:glycosyltransferase family 39 protein [Maribacter sp. 2210JD10-5]|uniref:glycosyltransferase family 39 protein n=1 Tax=Maribacter sp. 2210JD10-5 TaxID=3386272 RepID=UPI0039BC38BE
MGLKHIFSSRINILALLSFFAITGIPFFKSAMELEDAEQAYYSQWLRWGYDDQPPLYTWLQFGVNRIFGVSKFSFSLLRGLIFSSILIALHRLAKHTLSNSAKAELSVLCFALVPVFMDFTFRRLSHTSLLCLLIVSSFLIIQRLTVKKSILNYSVLGLLIGLGMLSKYNYVLFLGALMLSVLFDRNLRQLIVHRYFVVTMLLAALLVAPHFYWLLGPEGYLEILKESVVLKVESSNPNTIPVVTPLFSYTMTMIKLIGILGVGLLVAFLFKKLKFITFKKNWFSKFFWAQLVVLALFFIVLNIQKVEPRWLLPLFLPFSIVLMRTIDFKSIEKWSRFGFVLFLIVIFGQTVRTPIEKVLDIPSSVHFGFEPVSDKLNSNYPEKEWILPNVTYGGNVRILNPQKEIFALDDFSLPKFKSTTKNSVKLVFKKEDLKNDILIDSLKGFGKEMEDLYFIVD